MFWALVKTDFKLRYYGSWLGFFWVILKPLLIFMVLNFVFRYLFGTTVEHYSVWLFLGIMMWGCFSEGTLTGMTVFLNRASLITKIAFPKYILILAATANSLLTFFVNLIVLAVFFAFEGLVPSILGIFGFFFFVILLYALIVSFAFLMSPLYIRFRDLSQIWEVLLTAGFYATPIIYPMTTISSKWGFLLWLNPMTHIIHYSREFLIYGRSCTILSFFIYIGLTILLVSVSFFIFSHASRRVAELV